MAELLAIMARGVVEDVPDALAKAEALSAKHGVFLQLVDPAAVYNPRHLQSAWLHAERAKAQGSMSAKTLGAEFLMYVAGERQVHRAIEKAGIRTGAERTIVCAAGARAATALWGFLDKLGWSRDPSGIPANPAALARLGIAAGPDLEADVLERVAFVDLRK